MSSVGDKEKIETILSCPICGDKYDECNVRPKSLICDKTTHTFCISCIRNLIRNSDCGGRFKCPTCRHPHAPPPDGVDANKHYLDNKDRLELKDLLQNQITRPKDEKHRIPCDHCEVSEAVAWCGHCYVTMCKACCRIHDRFSIEGHPLATLIEKIDLSTVERKTLCQEHKGQVITFVCYDHDELKFICNFCAQDSHHKGHNLKDLNTEVATRKKEIDELFSEAVKRNEADINRKKMLVSAQCHLPINLNAVEQRINKCQDHLMKILQEQKDRKKCELLDIKEKTTSSLKKETDETTQRCSTFDNISNTIQKFHSLSPVAMMKDKKLLEDLKGYLASGVDEAPTTNVYMKVDGIDDYRPFVELLQRSTEIQQIPTEFQSSYPKVAFKDHRFELAIQTMSDNGICTVGGLPIRAKVHSPCCDTYENILPDYEVCGKYVFSFTPNSAGEYTFYVYIESYRELETHLLVSVHSLVTDYEKVVFCNEACQIKAQLTLTRAGIAEKLTVECQDEMGDNLKSIDEEITSDMLSATFQPSYLGKVKMVIKFDGMKVAGPFTSVVCKKMIKDPTCMSGCEITHLALNKRGSLYLADTQVNRRILFVELDNDPITVDNFDSKGTSFIAFDKYENQYVLFTTLLSDMSTTEMKTDYPVYTTENALPKIESFPENTASNCFAIDTKTELHISTQNFGKKTYFPSFVKKPAGFAVNPSGSVFAISDQEDHCIFLYQTPQLTNEVKKLKPFRILGEKDQRLVGTFNNPRLGTFNNPTALCIDNEDRLFVCDKGNGRVQVLKIDGELWSVFGPEEVRSLETPEAICLSPEGYLLILGRDKLFTFNVNHQQLSHHQRPIFEIEICCKGQNVCNFNHLLCCFPNKQVLRFCCGHNDMQMFTYVSRQSYGLG